MSGIKKLFLGAVVAALVMAPASSAFARQRVQKGTQAEYDHCVLSSTGSPERRHDCCDYVGGDWVVVDDGNGVVTDEYCAGYEKRGQQSGTNSYQGGTSGTYQQPQSTTSPSGTASPPPRRYSS